MILRYLGVAALGFSFSGATSFAEDRVIYGNDDRREVSDQANDPVMVEAAESTAVLVRRSSVRTEPGAETAKLPSTTFGQSQNVCRSERFYEQANPGFCSGFLVGKDILVTAGHCIRNRSSCDSTAFIFGFHQKDSVADTTEIPTANVFYCKELIAQELNRSNQNDYAVIRLDRPVEGRTPLKFRSSETISEGTEVTVIGHPSGLPTKIAGGAAVRNSSKETYFIANLDTYGGNSGSAVLNNEGIVEGILVRGEQDFVSRGTCRVSKECKDNACRGEDVTKSTMFSPFVPDSEEEERLRSDLAPVTINPDVEIPDNNSTGITETLEVSESGIIAELSLKLKLEHAYPGDLKVLLTNPAGKTVVLAEKVQGERGLLELTYGFSGTSVPDLRNFRESEAMGSWQLKIIDQAKDDTGKLLMASLMIRVYSDAE